MITPTTTTTTIILIIILYQQQPTTGSSVCTHYLLVRDSTLTFPSKTGERSAPTFRAEFDGWSGAGWGIRCDETLAPKVVRSWIRCLWRETCGIKSVIRSGIHHEITWNHRDAECCSDDIVMFGCAFLPSFGIRVLTTLLLLCLGFVRTNPLGPLCAFSRSHNTTTQCSTPDHSSSSFSSTHNRIRLTVILPLPSSLPVRTYDCLETTTQNIP